MAPSGSATSMWTVEHLQSGSTCQYMRYWAAGPLEDVDNWVWWNEGRGEAVAVGLPRPWAVIPSDDQT